MDETTQLEQSVESQQETNLETPKKTLEDFITDELKEVKALESFKNKDLEAAIPDLLKSYVNAQKLVGKRLADLKEEEIREFLELPQKPKSVDEYKSINEEIDDGLASFALDLELDVTQTQKFLAKQKEIAQKTVEEAKAKAEDTLHEAFGINYRKHMDLAKQAAAHLGLSEDFETLPPKVVIGLAKAGKDFLTGSTRLKDDNAPKDMSFYDKEIKNKMNDSQFYQLWKSGDRDAAREMQALYEKRFEASKR